MCCIRFGRATAAPSVNSSCYRTAFVLVDGSESSNSGNTLGCRIQTDKIGLLYNLHSLYLFEVSAMTSVATLSSKFQITIPSEARRQLGLRAGHCLEVRVKSDRIELVPQEPVAALLGMFVGADTKVPRERDRI